MSRLRAKCPDCRTFTAVAVGPGYECHACGREYGAGLVRVPRACGDGGESMAQAALLPLPYPEVASIAEDSLGEQSLFLATELPERPLVLGGCCCAHIGAVEGLAARHGRIAVVWLDAHGDLNTTQTSRSGNAWGTPLRTLVDSDAVDPVDAVLVGARNLDPAEEDYIASRRLRCGLGDVDAAVENTEGVYVALDADALEPGELSPYLPEPNGLRLPEVERLFIALRDRAPILGAGVTGLLPDEANVEPLSRLTAALGL